MYLRLWTVGKLIRFTDTWNKKPNEGKRTQVNRKEMKSEILPQTAKKSNTLETSTPFYGEWDQNLFGDF